MASTSEIYSQIDNQIYSQFDTQIGSQIGSRIQLPVDHEFADF